MKHLPNAVTLLLFPVAGLIYYFVHEENWVAAVVFYCIIAQAMMWLDGELARVLDAHTEVGGAYLQPAGALVVLVAALYGLYEHGLVDLWLLVVLAFEAIAAQVPINYGSADSKAKRFCNGLNPLMYWLETGLIVSVISWQAFGSDVQYVIPVAAVAVTLIVRTKRMLLISWLLGFAELYPVIHQLLLKAINTPTPETE